VSDTVVSDTRLLSRREELDGYLFWGLVAVFIGAPELLAAASERLKRAIPFPTISNLVGHDLERHHHWVALVVVALIVLTIYHTATYPPSRMRAGRALQGPAEDAVVLEWGRPFVAFVALAAVVAGLVGAALGANKVELGYAIYGTLAVAGVVVPSALAYWWNRVLGIPTLFATIAQLSTRVRWLAAAVVALLALLLFHLALYPWPNHPFGS
jgi:NADH:ubiquinone oxidoreductase subunit 2 (subunit N)